MFSSEQLKTVGTNLWTGRTDRHVDDKYKNRRVRRSQVQEQTGKKITGTRTDR
jgi:hypothetical protein